MFLLKVQTSKLLQSLADFFFFIQTILRIKNYFWFLLLEFFLREKSKYWNILKKNE